MKKLNLVLSVAAIATAPAIFADTLNSGGSLATSTAFSPNGPPVSFWNNTSSDTVNGSTAANVGNFLNDTGGFALNGNVTLNCPTCGPNYMAGGGQMYVNSGNTPDYVSNLNFVKQAGALQITLLYANSGANGFAEFGLYDASSLANSVNNHVILQQGLTTNLNNIIGTTYSSGTQFTGAVNNGLISLASGSPYDTWGLYVRTCTEGSVSFAQCNADGDIVTYYMGMPSQLNAGQSNDVNHQHFALFQAGSNVNQYYAGLEDWAFTSAANALPGGNGVEGYGDYNDIIFGITTSISGVPEPATLSFMGLGLAGLGLIGRKLKK